MRIRERYYYYDLLNPLLNSQRPYISEEELKEEKRIYDAKYREDNQDGIKKYKKEHKEQTKAYNAKYNQDNQDGIKKLSTSET